LIVMPTPDDWAREVDEALFGNDAADAPLTWHEPGGLDLARPSSEPQGRAVSVDELDAALFGHEQPPPSQAPTAPTAPPPREVAITPTIVDIEDEDEDEKEHEPEWIAEEPTGEHDALWPTAGERGRRRALVAAVVVAIGVAALGTVGAVAVFRSEVQPAGRPASDRTTTAPASTVATTTTVTTLPPPSPSPAPAPPAPPSTPRPAPRPTSPPVDAPQPTPTEPPPPEPPPPEPPPSTSPPTTGVLP
jgi:hypothetical protein